tara:strand:- start:128 stop:535 length:408 start_codon:yes stop_codon:yes gene_type:complete
MSQIKLLHSGGNGVILAAPSSNPAADRTLRLPGDADGTIATTATAGKILQVISDTKTDTQSFQSQSFQTISGLSVSITPSSSSNKVLVHYSVSVSCNNYGMFNLRRAGTEILRGDADGNRTRCTFESGVMNQYEM